jgi:hypothetical protein
VKLNHQRRVDAERHQLRDAYQPLTEIGLKVGAQPSIDDRPEQQPTEHQRAEGDGDAGAHGTNECGSHDLLTAKGQDHQLVVLVGYRCVARGTREKHLRKRTAWRPSTS